MNKIILSLVGGAALFAAQTNAATVNVTGAGSTFDYPAFTKWFEAYGNVDKGVQFNYQSIGSGGGKKNLVNQTVDFGASDAPMTDDEMKAAPGKILHIPLLPAASRSFTTCQTARNSSWTATHLPPFISATSPSGTTRKSRP